MLRKKFVFKLFVQTSSDLAAEFAKQGNTVLNLPGVPEVKSTQKNRMIHFIVCQSFSVFSITVNKSEKGSLFTRRSV